MQSFRPIRSLSGDIVVCSSSRDRNTQLVVCRIDERKKIKVNCIYVTAIISYLAIVIHVCCHIFSWEPMRDEGTSWEQHRTTNSISPPECPGGRKIHKLKKIFILFTAYHWVLPGGDMAWRLEQWRHPVLRCHATLPGCVTTPKRQRRLVHEGQTDREWWLTATNICRIQLKGCLGSNLEFSVYVPHLNWALV